jgi:hypothetical protein
MNSLYGNDRIADTITEARVIMGTHHRAKTGVAASAATYE